MTPHGSYTGYTRHGCRCRPCCNAATDYKRKWKAGFRVWVDAAPARRHLRLLSRSGVGLASVHAATDLNLSGLKKLRYGKTKRVRRSTLALILGVDVLAGPDNRKVDATKARAAIREMRSQGLWLHEIADRMGLAAPHGYRQVMRVLQRKRVWARTERRVLCALAAVRAELAASDGVGPVCADCGLDHRPAARQRRLARMPPDTFYADVRDAWPCSYGGRWGQRLFERDKAAIGMSSQGRVQ